MKIDFQKAFAVDIRHEYYPDQISVDFQIAPTADCQQQLAKYGLLFKETPGGFVVLYETTGSDGPVEAKRKIDRPLALSFVLWAKTPFLLNYSELPLDKSADQIFYLGNRRKNLNNGQLLLSADAGAEFLSAADLLALRPQRFQVEVETGADSILWEVADALGNQVQRQRVMTVEGISSYRVELASKPPGCYLLRRDGAEHLRFYAADRLVGGFPFGVVEIAADPQVNNAFSFVDSDGNVQFKHYLFKLQARSTTWEYYVVAKYETEVAPNDLSVTLDEPPVSFARQSPVMLADGRTAVPFIAGTALPLSRKPLKGITLRKRKGPSTPRLVIDNLPNPSVAEVLPTAGDKVISRIYVYV